MSFLKESLLIAAALGLMSCGTSSVPVDHEDYEFADPIGVDLNSEPWRSRRRMDVDQLDRSIRAVTGGMGWERYRGEGNEPERYFTTFDDTLGVPDYINSTAEDLTVSLLFSKFLDDAARSVCQRLADREAGDGPEREGAPQGTFDPIRFEPVGGEERPTPSAAEIDEALSRVLLRFHSRRLDPAADGDQLQPWRDLVTQTEAAAVAAEPQLPYKRTWEGVCVALMTHPDFYTY